jgi:proteasome lid subunit RPN8/RPN11
MTANLADPSSTDQMFDSGRRAERIFEVVLPESVQNVLTAICAASKHEVCGFIDTHYGFHHVDNVHDEKTHNFLMDEDSFNVTMQRIYHGGNNAVLGVWHTHPNNVVWPTPRDLAGWPNPDLKWHYWIVTNSQVIQWRLL